MSRIISICSGKGGVGKTTLAINIGAAIAHQLKRSVTLIDCNLTTSHLGIQLGMYNYNFTLNNVLRNECSMDEAVYDHFTGMKIVPASLSPKDLFGVDITKIRNVIGDIDSKNDIILLDSAPGLGRESIGAIKASDEIIYVTNPNVPAIMDIVRCQEVVKDMDVNPLGIILNMVNKNRHEISKKEVEYLTSLDVIERVPYDKNFMKSLSMKIPMISYKPNSNISKKFTIIASKIMEEEVALEKGFMRYLKNIFSFGRR